MRALLIQKSIKLKLKEEKELCSLRALLIQKSIKPLPALYTFSIVFESFVNSEEYQTEKVQETPESQFESFVNSEEYQTKLY